MNEHFVLIGKKISSKTNFQNVKNYIKFLGDRQLSSIYLRPTDIQEVFEIIANLNNRKASGYIQIPLIILKKCEYLISRYLTNSFNKC